MVASLELIQRLINQKGADRAGAYESDRNVAAAAILSLTSAVLFGTMNFLGRLASIHTHYSIVACGRAMIGTILALSIARMRGASLRITDRVGMGLRAVFGTCALLCTFFVLGRTDLPLGDAVTLFHLSPIFIAVLSPIVLGEHGNRWLFLSLSCSFVGILLILRPAFLWAHGGQATPIVPAGFAIAAAVASAIAMLMIRRLGSRESPEAIAATFGTVAIVATGSIAIVHRHEFAWQAIGWIVATGITGGLGQLAMTRAYALDDASRVSSLGYVNVIVSTVLGIVLLREPHGAAGWIGMSLVVGGGLVTVIAAGTKTAKATPSP